ncbi:DUF1330 domain-containing protein [Photobacterium galatheae]|uniref:DUF1330 domain-containing protein n=1 Tax=Photobacterium galatheae TaxID=1654360 RepID=A0A066RSG4_9GAMM|nr:DUF1330 domain-containing protein [Photobacterium galatheae]KDM93269.1 hypothetical protein EA58_01255 [Photobacterium galatheae]MCM0150391.1 DUF1330 domain-containing protein [Photobacterium galatheae]
MYEMIVGLDVSDNEGYANYRHAMTPILSAYGGSFGYDFQVSEVLLSQVSEPINRVFTIRFPNELQKNKFFQDPDYVKVKEQFFSQSVRHTTMIARYDSDAS